MIIEFDESNGLLDMWVDRIIAEYKDITHTNEYITKFVNKYGTADKPIKFGVRTESLGTHAIRDIFTNHKGHVSRKYVEGRLKELRHIENTSVFSMETLVEADKHGNICVTGGMLTVRRSVLARDLCYWIHDLDALWKQHQWLIRHEVGHLIDYMVNMHGHPRSKLIDRCKDTRENYSRHRAWVEQYKKEPGFDIHRINRAYYNIPIEARANEYAGIDIEDMIKMITEAKAKYAEKHIKLKIEVVGVEDEVKKS